MTKYFNRFSTALIALATLLEISVGAQSMVSSNNSPLAIPRRSSIILVVADGLGYGDLSCYGQAKFQTPNLDKLAADGLRFTDYSADKAAAVSDASLMLGKNAGHLRQRADADIPLASGDITAAQMLQQSGYHTGWVGDWGLGGENSGGAPWKKGFDEFAGYLDERDAENVYADYIFRYAPNTIYDETNKQFRTYVGQEPLVSNRDNAKGQFIPDLLAKAAMNFIKNNHPDPFNHYRPFFLVLHYKIPGDGKATAPSDAPYSDEPWPQPEKNRVALISRLDGYVGQLRAQLVTLGMTNNAVIFFTSDSIAKKGNGIDPDFFHSNVSSNDFRVPMILCWPQTISPGIGSLKSSGKDFLPTAAEIGYTKPPADIDGVSVLSAGSKQPQ